MNDAYPETAAASSGTDCQLLPVALPVTVRADSGVLAPGQVIMYRPDWRVTENPPDSPGVRFSCSPRIVLLSPVRSSASDTESASLFAIVTATVPAATEAGFGVQPCGVMVIATVAGLAARAAPAVCSLPPQAVRPVRSSAVRPGSRQRTAAVAGTGQLLGFGVVS